MKNRSNAMPTDTSCDGPAEQGGPATVPKLKKPLPTGAKLFTLVWSRAARQLKLLPTDAQRAMALGFIVEELKLPLTLEPGKLPPGVSDPRD